mgnify:FL=1
MIKEDYIEPEKKITVYTGAHGAGKTALFYKHEVHESWAEIGELPAFIGESQRSLSECFGSNHSDQSFNLQYNKDVLSLLYTGILKNESIRMDRCFLDVLIYNYYFDNNYKYECSGGDEKVITWFINNTHFYIYEPQEIFFNNGEERMDFESAKEIHKLFLDIDNVLSKILGFEVKLKKEYDKVKIEDEE